MRADHLTFRRATSISVVGLVLQAGFALLFLLYGLFGRDGAAITAAIYAALGLLVWLGLALIFHQHTLERLEALEQEALEAAAAGQSSVFEDVGSEIRVAARRLAWMHRFLLPAISLVLGALLAGVGLARFFAARVVLQPGGFAAPTHIGWAIACGLAAAVLGFVFARFVAGMAKQQEWSILSAGAAYAVGVALAGLALGVAHFVAYLGNDVALRYLHLALPIYMVVLGAETFLNFVLNIYRPRRAGEIPRPAFDSRLLGFLAAPDRLAESLGEAISYQFGFDVTQSWFYRLLSRTFVLLALFAGLLLWGLSTLAVVKPNEQGMILRFGAFRASVGSGLHFKLPWPIERLETVPALAIDEVQVGSPRPNVGGPIIWTEAHVAAGQEVFMLVQPDSGSQGGQARDLALVSIEVPIRFIVEDVVKYETFAAPEHRKDLLRAVAAREVIEYLATRTAGETLGSGRAEIENALAERITAAFASLDAGVRVMFVGVLGAHPPQDENVARSYEQVVAAEQAREARIEQANAAAIRSLTRVVGDVGLARKVVAELDTLEQMTDAEAPEREIALQEQKIERLLAGAGGEAESLIDTARADRWKRHMGERARASRHLGRIAAFRAAPALFRATEYFAALRDMASSSRVYIVDFPEPSVRINFEDQPELGGVPEPATPREE